MKAANADPKIVAQAIAAAVEKAREQRKKARIEALFLAAAEAVSAAGFGSNEVVRDALGIGYFRASELIKALQETGILGVDLDEHARLELLRPIGFF